LRRVDRFRQALRNGREAELQRFLESYPRPLHVVFNEGWNDYFAIPQFQFGPDYRADFVILSLHSGAWTACFIELKPPSARLYLRDGTESRALRTALRQIKDWSRWIEHDRSRLIDTFRRGVRLAREKGEAIPENPPGPGLGGLLDPGTVILTDYAIVIGRRATLSGVDNERRANELQWSRRVEIVTYDRLLSALERDLKAARELRQGKLKYTARKSVAVIPVSPPMTSTEVP
jgi:hypothetical protein